MTKGLESVFGLPSMEDILKETDEAAELEAAGEEVESPMPVPQRTRSLISNEEHAKASKHAKTMDEMYDEVMKHAKDAAELAFDLDPARAPRMLEVAAIYYKTAMEAKNSKRDDELKMIELEHRERKLAMEEAKLRHEMGEVDSNKAEVLMVEDRNTLLRRMREEAMNEEAKKLKD